MEIQGIAKVITANPEGIPCVWARLYDIPSWSSKKKQEIPTGTKWRRPFGGQSFSPNALRFVSPEVGTGTVRSVAVIGIYNEHA